MKKFAALVLCLCLALTGCSNAAPSNSGSSTPTEVPGSKPGSTSDSGAEAAVYKTYPATFTAAGTNADTYNEMMKELTDSFGAYFEETGELDKIAGYDEPITVYTSNNYNSPIEDAFGDFGAMYGESMENHRWIDAYKQAFNVDVKYKWLAQDAEYNQKLRLDMTAGDLPDIFMVKDQNDLVQLSESGAIWDLTDLMDQYAVSIDKEIWETDGGALLDMCTFDGKTYAIPCSLSDTDDYSYLWIRSDWMDKLGLSYPATVEELTNVIDAFVNADFDGNGQKDTVGILLDKDLYYSTRGLFGAFNSYPGVWVENNGTLEWGGISDTTKTALACLADWYQKGYINKEFITQDNNTAMESVLSGKCGVVYGGHWMAQNFSPLHDLDPDSDWYSIKLPTGTGSDVRSALSPRSNGFLVVNSKFEHPEIAFKLRALTSYGLKDKNSSWWYYEKNLTWQIAPVRGNVSSFDNLITYQNLMEAYNNNNDTSLLKAKAIPYWANLHGEGKWAWERMFGPGEHTPMRVLDNAYNNNLLFYNAYTGVQSPFMQERWSTILDEQLIAFTKIIIGEIGLDDGFQTWKNSFDSMGGNKITEEVNEWYKNK